MEDEIDLRQLIQTLWRGRNTIIAVTLAALLASGVVSFFIMTPVYEAETTLLVVAPPPLELSPATEADINYILRAASRFPQFTVETYKNEVTNPQVLDRVIAHLGLDSTREELARQVRAEYVKDSNLLRIKVSHSDPAKAAETANALVAELRSHLGEMNQKVQSRSRAFLEEEMKTAEVNMREALAQLEEFLSQPRGVDELQREVEAKTAQLTEFKTRVGELDIQVRALEASIRENERELEALPPTIKVQKTVLDDPLLESALSSGGTSVSALAGLKLEAEEVNEARVELARTLGENRVALAGLKAEKNALEDSVVHLAGELSGLQKELAQKRVKLEELQQRADVFKSAYMAFSKKYEESVMAESGRFVEGSFVVASPAFEPAEPARPRKLLNLSVAGVLGMMVGVMVAFGAEYWRASEA